MRTLLILDPRDESTRDLVAKLEAQAAERKGGLLAIYGLHFQILEHGPTITYYGRTAVLPVCLGADRPVSVKLKDDGKGDTPARGIYQRCCSSAFVTVGHTGAWEMTVTAPSLEQANQLYDDIRTGAIEPTVGYKSL